MILTPPWAFFVPKIEYDNAIIASLQRWSIFDVLEDDREKEEKERRGLAPLELSDLIPKRENIDRQFICFSVADKDALKFKELYENWIYSDVYRVYAIKLVQNRLEKEQYNAK